LYSAASSTDFCDYKGSRQWRDPFLCKSVLPTHRTFPLYSTLLQKVNYRTPPKRISLFHKKQCNILAILYIKKKKRL